MEKGELSGFECGMVVSDQQAGLSYSETADQLGLSETTTFRV